MSRLVSQLCLATLSPGAGSRGRDDVLTTAQADGCTGIDFRLRTVDVDGVRVQLQVRHVPPCSSKHLFCESDPHVLQIWDTSGVKRFHTVTSSYYRAAHAFVIGYDITDEVST